MHWDGEDTAEFREALEYGWLTVPALKGNILFHLDRPITAKTNQQEPVSCVVSLPLETVGEKGMWNQVAPSKVWSMLPGAGHGQYYLTWWAQRSGTWHSQSWEPWQMPSIRQHKSILNFGKNWVWIWEKGKCSNMPVRWLRDWSTWYTRRGWKIVQPSEETASYWCV